MTVVGKYLAKLVIPGYRRNKPSRKKLEDNSYISIRIYDNYLNNRHDILTISLITYCRKPVIFRHHVTQITSYHWICQEVEGTQTTEYTGLCDFKSEV